MHIIITVLTAAAGLIWALYRLQNAGVDLNAFNPFHWARRRRWEKLAGTHAIHRIESPREVASIILVAAATLSGQITKEQKNTLLNILVEDLHTPVKDAQDAYAYACYLLRDIHNVTAELKNILRPSKESFSAEQKQSLIDLCDRVIKLDSPTTKLQGEFLEALKHELGET